MNLQGKTALVTGGSSGLGLEITKLLLQKQVKVHICGRNQERLDEAKNLAKSDNLTTHACDVSEYTQIEAMIKKIPELDILINNAGIWLEHPIEENTPQEIEKVLNINLKGLIFATKACLPLLKQQKQSFIVNTISKSGVRSHEDASVYVASKFGARGFIQNLRLELKGSGVQVIGIYPTGMNNPGFFKKGDGEPKPFADLLDPKEVAKAVLFTLEQKPPTLIDRLEINRNNL